MRVVLAPDSFKESLSAPAVAAALAEGWRRVLPDAEIVLAPMADGGEGTVEALVSATGGHARTVAVHGPLGEPVTARYGVLGDGTTAVIEMAEASGLALVPADRRNPAIATTRGTGELMAHALDHGAERLLLGIGGSATNDGGTGMARALGIVFRDAADCVLPQGGLALADLARIDTGGKHPRLGGAEVLVACDVDNPLCGPHGASHVYGPQKGATPGMVQSLDRALAHYARVVEAQLGVAIADVPGSGAAGGLGGGLLAFCGATLRPGVELVAHACGLAEKVRGADLVITGEGRIDGQTVHGKTPIGVARVAMAAGVPVAAVAGRLGPGYEAVYEHGIRETLAITPEGMPLEEALPRTHAFLADAAEQLARKWQSGALH